ncbi:histidinol-phosphate transaminase [Alkalilimnicola ehrlichii]|uniref:Histidinol-phosphate aminotransferase n=1 Tax=Alkalilimnicola ehrlichii TaxID=351052 RepID=A0A3E0X1C6_9GAMM|nr:histidinol-phosphate transaminase [Alkalilimnicola ehrlichii]RFA30700.1 histidinol-phosphate transaminase [Alkalilimnicola ehrlichii]RFA38277.1 histidinol-phosphate transaminase [Alkalilimnicola ehrlichii]
MSRYWSPFVHSLSPYVPGEQPKTDNLVKLNTNENPFGPSPKALEAIRAAADDKLRLYPEPSSEQLRETIARYYGLTTEQVFIGNGSDEVLAHIFLGLLKHDRPLLFPDISYSFYPVYCNLYGIDFQRVPLDNQFAIRVDDYLQPSSGIIFPNPNAPTGRLLPLDDIERLLRMNDGVVIVVDEAYIDFGGESAARLIPKYPNLLVTQTLSKSRSLAGLRVGFALGQPALIEALDRVKNSFNSYPVDRLAQVGAIAAIEDEAYFEQTRQAVIANRDWLTGALKKLSFEVLPSQANFVFCRHPAHEGRVLAEALRARGVIVRHFDKPRIEQFLRISIGTEAECRQLIDALTEILG